MAGRISLCGVGLSVARSHGHTSQEVHVGQTRTLVASITATPATVSNTASAPMAISVIRKLIVTLNLVGTQLFFPCKHPKSQSAEDHR